MDSSNFSIIKTHFNELQSKYKNLELLTNTGGQYIIRGNLKFCGIYEGEEIKDCFEIKISLPRDYPNTPPRVKEQDNRIPKDFHKLEDGSLCLAASIEVRIKFSLNRTLLGFVDDLVIPYLFSFSFWEKNEKMPFGELSHGTKGTLEYYKDIFQIESNLITLSLIKILAEDSYRGHLICPCGSNIRLRHCHGPILLELKKFGGQETFFFEFIKLAKFLYKFDNSFPKPLQSNKLVKLCKKLRK